MRLSKTIILTILTVGLTFNIWGQTVPENLQATSVTVRASKGEGSGVTINKNGVVFVVTAAHVVASNRSVRVVTSPSGNPLFVVSFAPVFVVKERIENGRLVGYTTWLADIVKYSDANFGEDLAILKIQQTGLTFPSTVFDTEGKILSIGTKLFHVGSLLGQLGHNSFTTGVISQIGKILNDRVYDQTSCVSYPGSSGGGVFTEDGVYVGTLVRGAGVGFNLIVPMRRTLDWAKKTNAMFIFNDNPTPSILGPIELAEDQPPVVLPVEKSVAKDEDTEANKNSKESDSVRVIIIK